MSDLVNNMQLKVSPAPLSGERLTIAKIEGWFKKFETIAKFYGWGEKAYQYVPLFLEDKVQVAYDSIPERDRIDLVKVKASLIHSLLTQDPFEAFNARVMNNDESFLDFSYDLKQLSQRMLMVGGNSVVPEVADALARNQFLRGIDTEVSDKLRVLKLQSLDEMVERAQIVSQNHNTTVQKQEQSFYTGYYPTGYGGKGQARFNGKGSKGSGKGGKGYKGKGRHQQRDPYWFNRCYSCGQVGHIARYCSNTNSGMLAYEEEVVEDQSEVQETGN